MGQTVTLYNIFGTSKAKTEKAILVLNENNQQAWMPLSVAQVKFIGGNYKVKVTVPGWFFGKIAWKPAEEYKPKAKPANPYMGGDVGNLGEELMVLQEIVESETGEKKQKILEQIELINQAIGAYYAAV